MSIRNQVILSQLNPPAQRAHVLVRPRVSALLATSLSFPLTILHAGTGYGKSTALLAYIAEQNKPVFWYTLSQTDRDPALFLANLFYAFTQKKNIYGIEALKILELPESAFLDAMIAFVNSLSEQLPEGSLLVLDDFHHVRDVSEIMNLVDWFVGHIPPQLHILIATRRSLNFPSITTWRAKGNLFEMSKDDLAFTAPEVRALFETQYHLHLQDEDIQQLAERTEGWAIGLQMVWQSLRGKPSAGISQVFEDDQESRKTLFTYLAQEVLARQDEATQQFLLQTAVLSEMDSETCDFLLSINNSEQILTRLQEAGLFVEVLKPGVYRYHHIFREFLINRLAGSPKMTQQLHRRVASYFSAHQYWERAVRHHLAAGDYHYVNQILEGVGDRMIHEGREETIAYWISQVPHEIQLKYPYINYLQGEIYRFNSQFSEALEKYHTAERLYKEMGNKWGISLALRGQAQVYLDTIRPLNADQLLKDALSLLDPLEFRKDVADLLTLIAENQLNLGYPEAAESYLQQSRELKSLEDVQNDYIYARILLRTGRIDQSIRLLESLDPGDEVSDITRPQRFHREASLLLSLLYCFKGELKQSEHYAKRGIQVGRQLGSNFVQSVGFMRLGHPIQLNSQNDFSGEMYEKAIDYYQQAVDKVDVVRIHVEPYWGMCRAYGFSGRIADAERVAEKALAIAKKAGDEWIGVLIRISLGASHVIAGNYENAQAELSIAESSARQVGDPLALAAAQLWLAMNAYQQGYINSMLIHLEKVLTSLEEKNHTFLITKPGILGNQDPLLFLPLLFYARKQGLKSNLVSRILSELQVEDLDYHPGYGLRFKTFGGFVFWRGPYKVDADVWKREKAKHLLQILVANRGKWITREQITVILWPDADQTTAANNFKVTLHALNQVLEPNRPGGVAPYFIQRRGEQYTLNPHASITVDNELFEAFLLMPDDKESLQKAVDLYRGYYYENESIQEWLSTEAQYFHQRFTSAAEKLINIYMAEDDFEKALSLTQELLKRDPCWEPAYRNQMCIYHLLGNLSMVQLTFEQCQQILQQQLNSDVSEETRDLSIALLHTKA